MKTTQMFAHGLKDEGFSLVIEPSLNMVAFRDGDNTKFLAEKLWQKGWCISYVPRYDCVRVVIMPHVKRKHAEAFLKDLAQIKTL